MAELKAAVLVCSARRLDVHLSLNRENPNSITSSVTGSGLTIDLLLIVLGRPVVVGLIPALPVQRCL